MCEGCESLKAYDRALEDLLFRIKQHKHALIMDNADEAALSQTQSVNALYALLMAQRRLVSTAKRLEMGGDLREVKH